MPSYGPLPTLTWTGLSIGVNLGGGWTSGTRNSAVSTAVSDPINGDGVFTVFGTGKNNASGFVGGGQIGYNFQFGQSFLAGVETDFQGTTISNNGVSLWAQYTSPLGSTLTPLGQFNASVPWFGTVRARLGYLITPTILLYGTAGFGYGGVSISNYNNTRTGWTAGGGVEWMVLPSWSVKAEYLFVDLNNGGSTGTFTGYNYGYNNNPQINVMRAGFNYHFNSGGLLGGGPVTASY
jgi:outer membrane immunogenic protein